MAALRRDLWVETFEPEYGQYRQALADPSSPLHRFHPTAVLFALDAYEMTRMADPRLNAAEAIASVEATLDDCEALWGRARDAFGCQIIHQTILPVFPTLLGMNEHRLPGAPAAMLSQLNARLRERAAKHGVDLLAADARAAKDGFDAWHDRVLWHRAKQEVGPRAAPLYGELVARLLAAAQGRSAKCLVLDLDNTLWGGVIGDDGLEGIVIGQGSALGEAFAGFQAYCGALSTRGIILAACSKNDEGNALAAFERHPDMVLKRDQLSAFVANWNDKAANLREIAGTLNIGLDALVFADDNPFERNLIRRELPMVSVPELPEDPAFFAACISDAGYFEARDLSEEDRARGELYRANHARDRARADVTDLDAYLRSLEMKLLWRPFDRIGLQRIVQLINKTNQFNLTTRRYNEDEVAALMADPGVFTLQLRLIDRFGDNGMIAVVIGRKLDNGQAEIDTWLMSCRVLGRRVEEATLVLVEEQAARLGARRLIGRYRPTGKNGMVAEHYPKLGFAPIKAADGLGDELYVRAFGAPGAGFPIELVAEVSIEALV
ncbi:MAG: HAD family hydrolase [Methylobacteriaceae bacterium]|nr:HAD family hydrolase [Methylobacteriaceae bacterium]